uniref:Putative coat protein n=1 Tax=Bacteriophage sp. TaxID=38018 RepID=A0A7G8LRL8_9VIRU|nr:MAG: putative coat protein [Bacteriophage sp.]
MEMAFPSAAGYGNIPNGNFSAVIYSKQVQLAFRKASTIEDITNSDYFGEIAAMGDSVKIIKEPEITVSPYARGTRITPQDLDDEDFSLVIDKANYFAFKVDDIEEKHSHVNFMDLATNRAAYRLAYQYDQEVLGYLSGYKQSALHANADAVKTTVNGTKAVTTAGSDELLTSMKLNKGKFGSSAGSSIPVAARLPGATALPGTEYVSPVMLINRMGRLLDQQFVDSAGRWLVVDPVFIELLKDEDSAVLNGDFGGSGLQNGLVINNLHGFRIYVSNNLPKIGTGAGTVGTANADNYGVIVGGHDSAVASAQQITKTETYRDPDSFADIVRGMHLYGRKILRPEGIVTAKYNLV